MKNTVDAGAAKTSRCCASAYVRKPKAVGGEAPLAPMQLMEPSASPGEGFESSYLGKDVTLCGRFALSPRGARARPRHHTRPVSP